MITRRLEKIGVELPLLGFGCMRLPVNEDKSIDRETALAMVDYALKHGVNYFDTALMYHDGNSESFIGEALSQYPRESYMLTTKLHASWVKTKDDVERLFKGQLEKCRVDYFDFYLLHDVERTKFDMIRDFSIYDFLKRMQREGKIRHIGISSHEDAEHLAEFLDIYEVDVVQLQVNYVDWKLRNAEACYRVVAERSIPCIVMEPVKGGLLADVLDGVRDIYRSCDTAASPVSFALRWVASLQNVKMVLSGMSSMEQLVENTRLLADFKPLSDAERDAIAKAVAFFDASKQIPCTACHYCDSCPVGVDIPGVFGLFNRQAIFGAREHFRIRQGYGSLLSENQRGSACIECGRCVELCPQHIDIPTELKKAHEKLDAIVNRRPS